MINDIEISKNMENYWQFSKVYADHIDSHGKILPKYFNWRRKGFEDSQAHRYPKGKNVKPLFSLNYETDEKLTYIEACKKIYIPHYKKLVEQSEVYKKVKEYCSRKNAKDLYLWDFDGYDHVSKGMMLQEVINSENYKMGHAFIIYGLFTETLDDALCEIQKKEQTSLL